MTGSAFRIRPALYYLLIIAVTFAVFEEVRLNEFVWDTIPFVVNNPWVVHPDAHALLAMFTQYHHSNWQPMVWLSHSIDFALFDHNTGQHHLSNVAYHAVDACLVYRLTRDLLVDTKFLEVEQGRVALLSALIFAVHPQHVQSVAWLVERKDTLYALFTLLCFISYLSAQRHRNPGWRRFAPICLMALALMSKPMAVTIPVVLILFDIYPLNRWRRGPVELSGLIIEKWPYWILSVVVIAITLHTQQGAIVSVHNLPLWARPATAINNYLFYIYCYLVPVNLSPIYPYVMDPVRIAAFSYWLPGLMMLAGTLAASAWLWRRGSRWPMLMLLFYVVTLLPVSGLVAVGPSKALDYYSYLATLPLGLLISMAIVRGFTTAGRARPVVVALAASYLIALSLLTFQQVKIWRNELTVWVRAYELYPDSAYINRNLAGAYFAIGDYDLALKHARISARESALGEAYLRQMKEALKRIKPP